MTPSNPNARLEALCDGVFAIAMTLLILDVRISGPDTLTSTTAIWHELRRLAPTAFAFALSFVVIFISWVNHHALMKGVHGSSASFIHANGFLLLTVVVLPFPTSLLGEFLWTDHAAPAVVLYNAVLAAQSIGWILVSAAALKPGLTTGERVKTMREGRRNGYMALVLYSALAITAWWLPLVVAVITTATFVFWLAFGMRMKHT